MHEKLQMEKFLFDSRFNFIENPDRKRLIFSERWDDIIKTLEDPTYKPYFDEVIKANDCEDIDDVFENGYENFKVSDEMEKIRLELCFLKNECKKSHINKW